MFKGAEGYTAHLLTIVSCGRISNNKSNNQRNVSRLSLIMQLDFNLHQRYVNM